MCNLSRPEFHDEESARKFLEAQLWPDGPVCPHCGTIDNATALKGAAHRPGLYKCKSCQAQFTVTVGTLYERSKVPLHTWLAVTHLMMASKKGMSALQISRMIGLSYKTTWFLCHRIRESLRDTDMNPLGGPNTPALRSTKPTSAAKRRTGPSKRPRRRKPSSLSSSAAAVSARPMLRASQQKP
jgi:transposase-like protein